MIEHLETELRLLDQALETHVQAHPDLSRDRRLLQSIQGVGTVVSTLLLPILQPGRFKGAPQAAAHLGLVPVEHPSGTGVKGRPRLSKAGNATVRAKLYTSTGSAHRMAAIVATRYNPDVKALYERLLAKGKSKMSALGACMRKLVHMLRQAQHKSVLMFSSTRPNIIQKQPNFQVYS